MKNRYLKSVVAAFLLGLAMPSQAQPPVRSPEYSEAIMLYQSGLYTRARQLFIQAAEDRDDSLCEGYALLCALRSSAPDREKAFSEYVTKYPESPLLSRAYFEHAGLLFADGRYAEAEKEYGLVRPSSLDAAGLAELAFKTGWCRYDRKDYAGARNALSDLCKMPYGDYSAPARFVMGSMSYDEGNYDDALKWFALSAKDSRFETLSKFYLCDCRFMKKDYNYVISAGTELFPVLEGARRSRMARILSESYLVKGNAAKALEYHSLSSGQDKTRDDWFFSGSVLYAVGDYPGAIENYIQMTDRTDSLGQVANYQLGWSYIQTKNKVAALDAFKAASQADFNYHIQEDASFNYAKLAFDLNHDGSAFKQYLKEYSTLSKGDQVYGYMALAALYDKDYAAAVEAYDNVETLDGQQKLNYAKANYLRATQLTAGGSWRDAVPYLKAAAFYLPKQDPFNQLSRYWLAESYFHSGSYKDALSVYNGLYNTSALDGRAEGESIPYNVAYCHYRLRSYTTAARWFDYYLSSEDPSFRQDALVRRADCDFVRKNYKAAAAAYQKAIDDDPSPDNLYPRYQQGLSYGLAGNKKARVNSLSPVLKASPSAPLYCETLYELGRAYMDVENYPKAIETFTRLKKEASDQSFTARALIGLGMTHRNVSEYDKALGDYKQVVKMMPGSEYAEDALLAIESIYQARKQPEKFLEYVEANSLAAGKSEADREAMYFNTAEQVFLAENYPQALLSLQKYLDKYPNGEKRPEAWFYMAESYRLTGDKEKACDYYSKVLSSGLDGSFVELSRLGFASQSYALERYQDAYDAYEGLLEQGKLEANRPVAMTGMMRSAFRARNHTAAIEASDMILSNPDASGALIREAQYVKAKSLLGVSRREEALGLLSALAAEPSVPEGAEARWLLIQDAFDKGDFDGVETMVYDFAPVSGSQSYWLARAFLTLGDAFSEKGNAAQAKATWESVRDGYVASGPDDDIADIVKLKLDRLNNE